MKIQYEGKEVDLNVDFLEQEFYVPYPAIKFVENLIFQNIFQPVISKPVLKEDHTSNDLNDVLILYIEKQVGMDKLSIHLRQNLWDKSVSKLPLQNQLWNKTSSYYDVYLYLEELIKNYEKDRVEKIEKLRKILEDFIEVRNIIDIKHFEEIVLKKLTELEQETTTK